MGTNFPSLSIHLPSLIDVRFGPVVLSGRARFLAGIWRCVVGGGCANSSAMETVDLFLLRSGRGRARSVYVFEVSLRRILTPPSTICCSFLFLFLPGRFDVLAALPPVRALFGPHVLWGAVRFALHGVLGCSNPDNQMRYAMRRRVCRAYMMNWEYESCWSLVPLLRRASDTGVKMP